MTRTAIIAGSGPSVVGYDFPMDVPIIAVSGGYQGVPDMQHFATLDKPVCFPRWVVEGDQFTKHVPNWSCAPYWQRNKHVQVWAYEERADPCFDDTRPIASGGMLKSNVPDIRHNSLLFAVQLAPRLGFSRCVFIGCDLLPDGLLPVADTLRSWWPAAQSAGVEWVNASSLSTLCEWMPTAEGVLT